ncbi:hypothetical protein AK830_g7515 [Neonectria ditissima]|uniref:Uncharacterized protein n=1 Tax=Neonectria ditissima TaxID=78410 RepID=A0A0P7BG41_9HYPO|nr:hypothetical protein AK830_g7515 [Neonectria ditissima]
MPYKNQDHHVTRLNRGYHEGKRGHRSPVEDSGGRCKALDLTLSSDIHGWMHGEPSTTDFALWFLPARQVQCVPTFPRPAQALTTLTSTPAGPHLQKTSPSQAPQAHQTTTNPTLFSTPALLRTLLTSFSSLLRPAPLGKWPALLPLRSSSPCRPPTHLGSSARLHLQLQLHPAAAALRCPLPSAFKNLLHCVTHQILEISAPRPRLRLPPTSPATTSSWLLAALLRAKWAQTEPLGRDPTSPRRVIARKPFGCCPALNAFCFFFAPRQLPRTRKTRADKAYDHGLL